MTCSTGGEIAREIAAFYQAEGGLLTYEDLAAFPVQIEEPVRATFHEYDVFTCGPWCQGPVLAQAVTLLEGYDLAGLGQNSPAYVHLVDRGAEARVRGPRALLRRSEFVDVPMRALLSPAYAEARRRLIDPGARPRRHAARGRSVARQRRRAPVEPAHAG